MCVAEVMKNAGSIFKNNPNSLEEEDKAKLFDRSENGKLHSTTQHTQKLLAALAALATLTAHTTLTALIAHTAHTAHTTH